MKGVPMNTLLYKRQRKIISLYEGALVGVYFAAVCSVLFFSYFGIPPNYSTNKLTSLSCYSNKLSLYCSDRIQFGRYNEIDENSNIVWRGGMPIR
jgi:hypothetical protein